MVLISSVLMDPMLSSILVVVSSLAFIAANISSLSAVRDCLFNIFAATLHTWRVFPQSATWGRAMLWWQGTHLTWIRDPREMENNLSSNDSFHCLNRFYYCKKCNLSLNSEMVRSCGYDVGSSYYNSQLTSSFVPEGYIRSFQWIVTVKKNMYNRNVS
jgi:hypothetical protein